MVKIQKVQKRERKTENGRKIRVIVREIKTKKDIVLLISKKKSLSQ